MNGAAASELSPSRPFPGLRPYDQADHKYFFGRDEQILSLYRLLDRGRFTAVVGSSGSGKSSLVAAGLLPAISEEVRGNPPKPRWLCLPMRPGNAPFVRLAEAISGPSPSDADEMVMHGLFREKLLVALHKSSFGLAIALREVARLSAPSILVLVDQFEEIFRFANLSDNLGTDAQLRAARRDEAAAFVQLLLEAARDAIANVHVMLTMRSDYIGDCARFPGLSEQVSASQYLVPGLTRDQRERAIRGPVELAEGAIDEELVQRLLNDSIEEPDQLPVLQHTLMRLWEEAGRRQSKSGTGGPRRVTQDDYQAIGGLAGALSQHAEEVISDFPILLVEEVFRALAEFDREGRVVRRPLSFTKLLAETGAKEADLRKVLNRLSQDDCSFLRLEDADIVDIGHEALIRRWTRVSGSEGWLWREVQDGLTYRTLNGLRPALLTRQQLRKYSAWWAERQRTPAWAERYGGHFRQVEKMLTASRWWLRGKRAAFSIVLIVAILGAAWHFRVSQLLEAADESVRRLQAENSGLEVRNKDLEAQKSILQASNASFEARNRDLEADYNKLRAQNELLRAERSSPTPSRPIPAEGTRNMFALSILGLAGCFGALFPLAILLLRKTVRLRRQATIRSLQLVFEPDVRSDPQDKLMPTLVFLRKKYSVDQDPTLSDPPGWTFLVCSMPLVLLAFAFGALSLGAAVELFGLDGSTGGLPQRFIGAALDDMGAAGKAVLWGFVIVFVGGYFFAIRGLIHSVNRYDLSPGSYISTALKLMLRVVLAMLIVSAGVSPMIIDALGAKFAVVVSITAALLIGFVPEFGPRALYRSLQLWLFKHGDAELYRSLKAMPVEIIDGIDTKIWNRLTEFDIRTVQHIATADPLILFVETSYDICQCVNWVAQAQLYAAAGPQAMLRLRKLGLRTIFDLEKAVLHEQWCTPHLRQAVGRALLAGLASPEEPNVDEATIKSSVAIMLDNLHVQRLRHLVCRMRATETEPDPKKAVDVEPGPSSPLTLRRRGVDSNPWVPPGEDGGVSSSEKAHRGPRTTEDE